VLDRVFGAQIGQVGRMALIGGVIAILVVIIGALGMREKSRAPGGRTDGTRRARKRRMQQTRGAHPGSGWAPRV
jgi:hypothetical protein